MRGLVIRAIAAAVILAAPLVLLIGAGRAAQAAEALTVAGTAVPAASDERIRLSLVFYWFDSTSPAVRVTTIVETGGAPRRQALVLTLAPSAVWRPEKVEIGGTTGAAAPVADGEGLKVTLASGFTRAFVSIEGRLSPEAFDALTGQAGEWKLRPADFALGASPPEAGRIRQVSALVPQTHVVLTATSGTLPLGGWHVVEGGDVGAASPLTVRRVPVAAAPPPELELMVDGTLAPPTLRPRYAGGSYLVPLRGLVEFLGGTVSWDARTSRARVVLGAREAMLRPGSYLSRIGGRYQFLDVAPVVEEGRLRVDLGMLPALTGLAVRVDPIARMAWLETAAGKTPAGGTGGSAAEPPATPTGTVYLTFDDGPTHLTPRFLEVLADRGVPATFFVIGTSALARPDMIRRIAAEGHQIGNHTFDHHAAHLYTGDTVDFIESCRTADAVLQRICGVRTTVVRPPYGHRLAPDLVTALAEAGWRVVMWNCSAADTAQPAPDAWTIFDTVTARAAALTRSGPTEVVVLMHELGGREASLEAVPFIIDHLRAKGYVFATFDRGPVRGWRGSAKSPGGF